jgi:hypothetical protein
MILGRWHQPFADANWSPACIQANAEARRYLKQADFAKSENV